MSDHDALLIKEATRTLADTSERIAEGDLDGAIRAAKYVGLLADSLVGELRDERMRAIAADAGMVEVEWNHDLKRAVPVTWKRCTLRDACTLDYGHDGRCEVNR